MSSYKQYGTEENPVRMSSAPSILSCPAFAMRAFLDDGGPSSGAAHSGSAAGEVIRRMDVEDIDIETALDDACEAFPLADREGVENSVRRYQTLHQEACAEYGVPVKDSYEKTLELEVGGVYFVGHCDQVRRNGGYYLWDLKRSGFGGPQLVAMYAVQLACYTIAGRQHWPRLEVGGIIRLTKARNSRTEPELGKMYYRSQMSVEGARALVEGVAREVRRIRRGEIAMRPGSQCCYCPFGDPGDCLANALREAQPECIVCGKPAKPRRKTCGGDMCLAISRGKKIDLFGGAK